MLKTLVLIFKEPEKCFIICNHTRKKKKQFKIYDFFYDTDTRKFSNSEDDSTDYFVN